MNSLVQVLPLLLLGSLLALMIVRQQVMSREPSWWIGAILDGSAVAALCGGVISWSVPTWISIQTQDLVQPAVLFLAGWVGLEIGCGLDLRVVRRASFLPFLTETASALTVTVVVFAVAYAVSSLLPGGPQTIPAMLLILSGICVAGPALPASMVALSRGAGRGGFWNPSVAAALAVLLAATGMALVSGTESGIYLDSPYGRLLWAIAVGCVAGLVADLGSREDFAPGGLYPQIAAVVLVAAGIAGAVGIDTLLVGTICGFWLVNATLRRLDILHVVERGATVPRLLAPFLAGWLVGDSLKATGVDSGVFLFVLLLLLLLRPTARVLARRMLQSHSSGRRQERQSASVVEINEIGILLVVMLTRFVEPATGAGAVAAVLLAKWLLGIGAQAWEQREAAPS
jgi:hypothetical protein